MTLASKNLLTAHLMECHDFNPLSMENTTELDGDQNIKIETKQFQCDICQQYLKSKASLQVHVIIKHQKESHKYKCQKCDFSTFEKGRLNTHIRIKHQEVKDLKCDQCNYATNMKQNLVKHIKSKHKTSEQESQYQCQECDSAFSDKKIYAAHLLDEHNIVYQCFYQYKN